jgi:hypothetical protein
MSVRSIQSGPIYVDRTPPEVIDRMLANAAPPSEMPKGDFRVGRSPGELTIIDNRCSWPTLVYEFKRALNENGDSPLKKILIVFNSPIDEKVTVQLDTITQPETKGMIADNNDNSNPIPFGDILKKLVQGGFVNSETQIGLMGPSGAPPRVTPEQLQKIIKDSGYEGRIALQVGNKLYWIDKYGINCVQGFIRDTNER